LHPSSRNKSCKSYIQGDKHTHLVEHTRQHGNNLSELIALPDSVSSSQTIDCISCSTPAPSVTGSNSILLARRIAYDPNRPPRTPPKGCRLRVTSTPRRINGFAWRPECSREQREVRNNSYCHYVTSDEIFFILYQQLPVQLSSIFLPNN